MLHKFVAASQAQSRSWKTYMKRMPSCVFWCESPSFLPSLVSYMPLAHADFKRVEAAPRGYLLKLAVSAWAKALFFGARPRAALVVVCVEVFVLIYTNGELNSSGKGCDLRPARRVRGRRGILTNKGTQYPSSDRLLIERTRSLNAGSAPF
jgi:hypothetical protein